MNLRQIEILRAVVRCQTTVRAARELGLSQPAVSNAIRHLEAQVGFALFERVNNRLFPTAEARALYRDSEAIFALHAAFEARVQDLRENRAGHVSIVATPPLGYSVIPGALRSFLARFPDTRVRLDIRPLEHIIEQVETGVAELGFAMGLEEERDLEIERFFSGDMVAVMHRENPLARAPVVTPASLRGERLIALERGTRMGTILRDAFARTGERFRFAVEVRYCHTACVLARNEVGVAVVDPLSAVLREHPDLVMRPFVPASPMTAMAVRSRKRPASRAAEALLAEVRRIAGVTAIRLREAEKAAHLFGEEISPAENR